MTQTLYSDVTTPMVALPMDEATIDAMRLPAPPQTQIQPSRQSTLDICLSPDNQREFLWRMVGIYFSIGLIVAGFTFLWILTHQ